MTGLELSTLWNDAGIVGIEADRLAFVRWLVRAGRVSEGTPGGPLPDLRYAADDFERGQIQSWIRGLSFTTREE